ncbi:hypothetical protein [Bacillus sp. OTU530]|uniref:hypothetical protein n=1 Tax=Bacillus sp. OTU530 TaxID=3043862 RepID=UPI00313F313C
MKHKRFWCKYLRNFSLLYILPKHLRRDQKLATARKEVKGAEKLKMMDKRELLESEVAVEYDIEFPNKTQLNFK